jgi:hypothetical protein
MWHSIRCAIPIFCIFIHIHVCIYRHIHVCMYSVFLAYWFLLGRSITNDRIQYCFLVHATWQCDIHAGYYELRGDYSWVLPWFIWRNRLFMAWTHIGYWIEFVRCTLRDLRQARFGLCWQWPMVRNMRYCVSMGDRSARVRYNNSWCAWSWDTFWLISLINV